MDGFQNNDDELKKPKQNGVIPFTENSRKCKFICGDRTQTSGCLGQVGSEEGGREQAPC